MRTLRNIQLPSLLKYSTYYFIVGTYFFSSTFPLKFWGNFASTKYLELFCEAIFLIFMAMDIFEKLILFYEILFLTRMNFLPIMSISLNFFSWKTFLKIFDILFFDAPIIQFIILSLSVFNTLYYIKPKYWFCFI